MEIIPAIDLRGGRVVRLVQGDPGRETGYSDDPAAVALEWQRRGARRLHLVDLDGAFAGFLVNHEELRRIFRTITVPAQLGGGLRSLDAIRAALDLGAAVAIVSTAAVRDPAFLETACAAFPGQVALGLDARGGMLVASGWSEGTAARATEFARRMGGLPLAAIISTEVQRDGMLEGPDLEGLSAVASATRIPVIASGGVSSIGDIQALKALVPRGVAGAIIGRALYEGRLTLEAALAAARMPC
jgi:phosphoribosylformimino-5-aminoimidazole carboxamide ribotide isomerase